MATAHPTARPASKLSLGRTNDTSEANWTPIQLEILNALKSVPDPEIGLSIVDLGLVRDIEVLDDGSACVGGPDPGARAARAPGR
jgi:hypothetical protein